MFYRFMSENAIGYLELSSFFCCKYNGSGLMRRVMVGWVGLRVGKEYAIGLLFPQRRS